MLEDYSDKRVIIRVDFNVPLDDKFKITDHTRIEKAIPTIHHVLEHNGCVVLLSHLGRPQKKLTEDGKIDVQRFTLEHLVEDLTEMIGVQVTFCPENNSEKTIEAAIALERGQVLLIENTRFHPGETKGDEEFAKFLSGLGDYYINDAFGTAHRAHSSTTVIAKYFDKEHKGFGLLMSAELENARQLLNGYEKPFTAILGGAKVSDKIQLIDALLNICDDIIIGGGMAYTFIKATGGKTGNSLCENDYLDTAKDLLKKAEAKNVNIHIPFDSIIANDFSASAEFKLCNSDEIPEGWMGLDIGPMAIAKNSHVLSLAKTILWNGPMGVFEFEASSKGTLETAKIVAESTSNGAFSLVGGGDSVSALNKSGLADKISFVSTGGGAMLEFLEGKKLPGVAAIED